MFPLGCRKGICVGMMAMHGGMHNLSPSKVSRVKAGCIYVPVAAWSSFQQLHKSPCPCPNVAEWISRSVVLQSIKFLGGNASFAFVASTQDQKGPECSARKTHSRHLKGRIQHSFCIPSLNGLPILWGSGDLWSLSHCQEQQQGMLLKSDQSSTSDEFDCLAMYWPLAVIMDSRPHA